MASTGVGTSNGNRMSANQISRPGRSVRSVSQARPNAIDQDQRDSAGDEHESVRQDARRTAPVGHQACDILERPARAGFER